MKLLTRPWLLSTAEVPSEGQMLQKWARLQRRPAPRVLVVKASGGVVADERRGARNGG